MSSNKISRNTRIITVTKQMDADLDVLAGALTPAAQAIATGGLVAFPTETVYGLGANAYDSEACRSIFEAKRRPPDNPLIVHVADTGDVACVVKDLPPSAELLMDAFWPGPLTLVLRRSARIPDVVTAGLETVAVRLPDCATAVTLIRLAGVPVAAPSANTSGRPSPTSALHVIEDLDGCIDWVIDGGKTNLGLESTVLDLTGELPVVLRPGGITVEQLEEVLGSVFSEGSMPYGAGPKSPGMKYKHYSPRAKVLAAMGSVGAVHDWMVGQLHRLPESERVGVLCSDELAGCHAITDVAGVVVSWGPRANVAALARCLYGVFRDMDANEVDVILVEAPSSVGIGRAVLNRLAKATSGAVFELRGDEA